MLWNLIQLAGRAWLMPIVIVATWEAEIERIMVWGQFGQTVLETPPLPK
jgi:hypothetical protein